MLPLPADSRIVGSIAYTGSSSNVVEIPLPPAAAEDSFEKVLLGAGWTKRPWPPQQGSGFQSTAQAGTNTFCRGDSVSIACRAKANARDGSTVTAIHVAARPNMCRAADEMRMRIVQLIPPLKAPAGAVVTAAGGGGGSEEQRARARLTTTQSVDELTRHYAAQLIAAGWKPLRRFTSDVVGVENYRVTDDKGAEWHALLTVSTTSADAVRYLSVHVERERMNN